MSTEYRRALAAAEEELKIVRADFLAEVAPGLRTRLREARKHIAEKWQHEFDSWCRTANVTVHMTPPECLQDVVDAYFEGKPPFRAPKMRADFPDALILATIRRTADEVGELHFIARDEGLAHATAGGGPAIRHYSSIDSFLAQTYQALATRTDERLFDLLFANVSYLEGQAGRLLNDELSGEMIDAEKISAADALIRTVNDVKLFLRLPRAERLGGGYFRFPFTAEAYASVESYDFIGDWDDDPDDENTVVASSVEASERNGDDADDSDDDDDDDDGNWSWGGGDDRTRDMIVAVDGILEVYVPYALPSGTTYAPNEDLRRAMYTSEFDVTDVEILEVR
jgi:hypothetical protein